MTLQVAPCYFAGQLDTCIDFPASALQPGTWNFFYRENGEIFAAVHPGGANTGSVNVRLSATSLPALEDPSGNSFYPRSLWLNTSHKLLSDIKIRYYMSTDEINRYSRLSPGTLMLLHREEAPEDCRLKTGNTSIPEQEDSLKWESTGHEKYRYLEFETRTTGLFLLWKNEVPAGRLSVETDPRSAPYVLTDNIRAMPFGEYLVQKSREGTVWQEWRSGIHGGARIRDATPYIPETYYRLVFDFGNAVRAVLDTRKAIVSGEQPECILLGNPLPYGLNIDLWFPDLLKSSTRLFSLQGQEIPLLSVTENGDHYRINPANTLPKGTYYLKARNRSGIPCTKRVMVY
ncbi:MAG: T9SS type A sorting domain-containing protein [Leadbetterella sp.]|nr:T9SS type A sorting domain-containing protein [Leadbetterella sp.]